MPLCEAPSIPRANVLGVGIAAIDLDEAVCFADRLLQRKDKGYICATGVHGIMESQRDEELRGVLNRSYLCVPDGMPTVWVGRFQGHHRMARVYGPDLMLALCKVSTTRGYKHFLYGGKDGVAEELKRRLQEAVPGLNVVGTYTPPFGDLSMNEESEVTDKINASGANIVWVGISTPNQERFMAHIIDRLRIELMVGVGAAFDFHAGLVKDAPGWMKHSGLQWLHRLIKEPRRLWKRYLRNNPQFIWEIALQLSGLKGFEIEPS